MAATAKGKKKKPSKRMWLIDPIYRRFTVQAFKNLTSGEFYKFFMEMLKNGEQQFQFSNRKIKIDVDETWIEIIEATIPAFLEITRNPRVIITQEELITNVVQAKKIDSQVVRHLCAHSYLVDAIDENGDVIPSKVLNIFKEETWDTYENRFVYTLLKKTFDFVAKRYQDMKEALNDEFGATLLIDASGQSKMEELEIHSKMKIRQKDDWEEEDGKKSVLARVRYLYETLGKLMQSRFAKEMAKFQIVRPPLVPTNAIKKNPFLRKCTALWNFLLHYSDAGFTVEIIEQNPEINQKFEQDIFDNIMFTYIILKGYLEDNRDRALDRDAKARRRYLRPKYIKQIIEEIVENYNMSEVEVRKVLIEELTKEQLLREEREERYRLVEEKRRADAEKKRREEEKRLADQKEKERRKKELAKQKAKEKARIEREKAREKARIEKEKEKKAILDEKRLTAMEEELIRQMESIERMRLLKYKNEDSEEGEAVRAKIAKQKAAAKAKSAAKTPGKPVPKAPPVRIELDPETFSSDFGKERSEAEMQQYNRDVRRANPVPRPAAKQDVQAMADEQAKSIAGSASEAIDDIMKSFDEGQPTGKPEDTKSLLDKEHFEVKLTAVKPKTEDTSDPEGMTPAGEPKDGSNAESAGRNIENNEREKGKNGAVKGTEDAKSSGNSKSVLDRLNPFKRGGKR